MIQKNKQYLFLLYFLLSFSCQSILSIYPFDIFNESEFNGIKDNTTYRYSTLFDKSPLNDMFEDMLLDEEESEIMSDYYFEMMDYSEKTKEWIIEVIFVSAEKEMKYENRELNYNTITYKLSKSHKSNDDSAKKTIDNNVKIRVVEYSRKYYSDLLLDYFEVFTLSSYNAQGFFLAKNIRWNSILNEIEKHSDNEYFDYKKITVNFINDVGIKMIYQNNDLYNDMKQFESIDKYNNDGILYYKAIKYDNKYIVEFSLQMFNSVIYEYFIVISLILIIVITIACLYLYFKNKNN